MPPHLKVADLPARLAALGDANVEFIIVGRAAAVIQGAPITTVDLDIVHRKTVERAAAARHVAAARRDHALRLREQRTATNG